MGNIVAYDRPDSIGNQLLNHDYFVKRKQEDLHFAWLWLRHISEMPNPKRRIPNQYLIKHEAEKKYIELENTRKFEIFREWMGRIPV